jgi:hypothetical protein
MTAEIAGSPFIPKVIHGIPRLLVYQVELPYTLYIGINSEISRGWPNFIFRDVPFFL